MRVSLTVMLILLLLCPCAGDAESTRLEIPAGSWESSTECGKIVFVVTDDARDIASVTFSYGQRKLNEWYQLAHLAGGWPIDGRGEFEIPRPQLLNDITFRGQFSQDATHATGTWELPSGQHCDWRAELLASPVQPTPTPEPVEPTGRITFESDRDGDDEIYLMNADGSDQTNLTGNPASDQAPAWSPDGSRIAFFSDRDGDDEIYLMNADGSGQTRLTHNSASDAFPAWSPDGTRIAFESDRDGNSEVYAMNVDGSGQTNLTNNPVNDGSPAWSPDGKRLVFSSNRSGSSEWTPANLHQMNLDGSGLIQLTDVDAHDVRPAWSPDGSQIAYIRFSIVFVSVYVMDADGSNQASLIDGSCPSWSPDGKLIAYSDYPESNRNSEIYIVRPDGSGRIMLTDNPARDSDPDWAP